jgi:uncharacterized repeat protein (TIGR01451 family)
VVRDALPEALKFVSSQPEPQNAEPVLVWHLGTISAGSERRISLTVEPIANGNLDHGATVEMRTGARAKTVVQEPKLKVEQTVSRSKVLKGEQVQFDITVTNTGSGPARNVLVRAKLTEGLKHEYGNLVELPFAEALKRETLKQNESITLSPLVVDTVAGGLQACDVEVSSPDVVANLEDAKSHREVDVTEPLLKLQLAGSKKRYTDTIAAYVVTVENPGSAPAHDVLVSATLQGAGRPSTVPKGAVWNPNARRLQWTIPQLEPKSSPAEFRFEVKVGGVQLFTVNAEAVARSVPRQSASWSTDVTGHADVNLDVTERLRVVDVGQQTTFRIQLKNTGTKEASHIQLYAKMSPNLKVDAAVGTEQKAGLNEAENKVVYPEINRLVPGGETVLTVTVTARAPGLANCHVYLTHDDLERGEIIEAVRTTQVTGLSPGTQ